MMTAETMLLKRPVLRFTVTLFFLLKPRVKLFLTLMCLMQHRGVGYDIRKRNIWDMYDEHTDLREATVTPDDLDLITDYDWLLGNHSDELTPWIPVMATR